MSSLISIGLYCNSHPLLLVAKDTYNYKQVLDLNEKALSNILTRHLSPHIISHVEPLFTKQQSAFLILLFSAESYNPFASDELHVQPIQDIIKGLKASTPEQLQKAVTKHQYELHSTFSDILNGIDMSKGGKTTNPRFAKKQTDFFEIKYSDVEQR